MIRKRSEEIACAVVSCTCTCSVFNGSYVKGEEMPKKRSSEIFGDEMHEEVRNLSFLCSCKLSLKYALLGTSSLENDVEKMGGPRRPALAVSGV